MEFDVMARGGSLEEERDFDGEGDGGDDERCWE
jgi:hypothetical protein